MRSLRQGLINAVDMAMRVAAIVAGGCALATGLAALTGLGLHAIGMSLNEAMLAAALLGFLYYVGIIMWGFVDRTSLLRPAVVVIGAIVSIAIVSALAPGVLPA